MPVLYSRTVTIERREGTILAGRFRLDRLLGQGGMGVVWAVTNTVTGRHVAMKLLHEDAAKDPGTRRRFLREGRAASAVQHPNVVEILDFIELEDQTPAMVMELLEGESLGQRLRRERKLTVAEVARVMVPAIGAVGTAHAYGVVHRDLKPDNIFLSEGHEGETVVKVLDFGIAKMSAEPDGGASNALTGTGAMLGTPYYMAPEQLFTDETLDYRCDIWALGIILYECLAGMRPTRANSFADIVKVIATQSMVPFANAAPDVPAEIASLITRMLSFDKAKRPQTLREVSAVLHHYTDVLATSFGEPILRPVKQTLDDSGDGQGLRQSDVALLFGTTNPTPEVHNAPTARNEFTPADGPATVNVPAAAKGGSGGSSASAPPLPGRRDSQSETLGRSAVAQDGASSTANTGRSASSKRTRNAVLAGAVLSFAVAGGLMATSEKKSTALASTNSTAEPRASVEIGAGAMAASANASANASASASANANAASANAASASAGTAESAPSSTTSAPSSSAKPAPSARPARPTVSATAAPGVATAAAPTAPRATTNANANAPGGLVEKPPF